MDRVHKTGAVRRHTYISGIGVSYSQLEYIKNNYKKISFLHNVHL